MKWLVRHAGSLLDRYHVRGNKETAFEDRFGKPYQVEVTTFAEAALFCWAVSSNGKQSEVRQGRADAGFVRGIWLGKTLDSADERVPDTEQRRLVKTCQGTSWDRLAGRPAHFLKQRPSRHLLQPQQASDRGQRLKSATARRRKI